MGMSRYENMIEHTMSGGLGLRYIIMMLGLLNKASHSICRVTESENSQLTETSHVTNTITRTET